jgi:hypothetical protein
MDRFSFFFAFYSLILGLAITEVLGGFGRFVRSHSTHKLGAQTALLALFTFVSITATWIDAFTTLKSIDLDVQSLWAPILTSTFYYLAASVVFPSSPEDFDHLDGYFAERKRFVVGLLFACELLATYSYLPLIIRGFHENRASTILFYVPLDILLKGSYIVLLFTRSKRGNIAMLLVLIALLLFIYWDNGAIARAIQHKYGAAWSA